MGLIQDIHHYLADDITQMNNLIFSHLKADEELITLIGEHLVLSHSKRIRPILTILTSRMLNYKGQDNIKLATAVELIHTATLLHDDVIDESKMRRFKPTANVIWGNKASILVGDYLFSQAFKLMVSTKSLSALMSLSKASAIVAEGEIAQLAKLKQKRLITKSEYYKIIQAKTAELFGAACEVGAIISESSLKTCNILKQFGVNLGNIFQIVDDLLDYAGFGNEIGKNIGDDFIEGKVTLPLIVLYESLNSDDQLRIDEIIRAQQRSDQDFSWVLSKINQYKIKNKILEHLEELRTTTTNLINDNFEDNKYREYLLSLISFAVSRSY